MHPFVAAVLLRVTRLDPFDADAQAQPPDGELAQVEQRMRGGKRHDLNLHLGLITNLFDRIQTKSYWFLPSVQINIEILRLFQFEAT